MTKASKLNSLVEEVSQPPASGTARRIYTAGRKVKMYAHQVTGQIADYVETHRWGISAEDAGELGVFYLTGEFTSFGDKPWEHLAMRYQLSDSTAKHLWDELEKRFGHFRRFFDTHDTTNVIFVQGKNITAAPDEEKF